ncbi:MAG: hypothetical protein ACRYG2_15510 [Janthinobacterium lividum]
MTALRAMIDAFYDRVESGEPLAAFFSGGVGRGHREHVADGWTEVFGGPATCPEQHVGYEACSPTTGAWDHARAAAPVRVVDERRRGRRGPADPEFRPAPAGPRRVGTRLAMAHSRPDAAVTEHAPGPRWGWGLAPSWTGWRAPPRPELQRSTLLTGSGSVDPGPLRTGSVPAR